MGSSSTDMTQIKKTYFDTLNSQAQSVVSQSLNIHNMEPLDEGLLGDFPWFWNNAGTFNGLTYNWLNNLISYNSDGYLQATGGSFINDYYNVMMDINYVLSPQDQSALNNATNAAATIVNTTVSDFVALFGPIPAQYTSSSSATMNYIISVVLSWGVPGLTLNQLRTSTNPMALLPNIPFGAASVVNDVMSYLNATTSVQNIQSAVISYNAQITQIKNNLNPAPPTAKPGWMLTTTNGQVPVPAFNISPSTASIQNALYPTGGGNSFSVSLNVSKLDQNTVKVSASGGIGGSGWIDFFKLSGGVSASYNAFSFDQQTTDCSIKMTYNGVTAVTPAGYQYDVTSGTGWWDPAPIKQAVNYSPSVSGYKFTPQPPYNFGANGNFGFISSLIVSQQPVFELTYTSGNFSQFQQTFQEQSSWGISFLGIPLAGGSQSYYNSQLSQNSQTGSITIKMSPPLNSTPVPTLGQVAYVIGAQVIWPGV